jgi:hypothetical protein
MEILEEVAFVHHGIEYLARTYWKEDKPSVYGEIVYKETKERSRNMKGTVREYLRPFGIHISTSAYVINTHDAVKTLIQHLKTQR